MLPRSAGSWPGDLFTRDPLRLAAGGFGLGHGDGAHAPNVYYLIESARPKVQGFRDEAAFRKAHEAMLALPLVEAPLRREVFADAVTLYRSGRRSGLTIRSSVDCLVAACALRHGLTVLHHDRDFDLLARVSALKARNVSV